MGQFILHHEGKFLVYSSECDAPIAGPFNRAALEDWILEEAKSRALEELEKRIERAISKGTSGLRDSSARRHRSSATAPAATTPG